jgi:hypothetical protein
MRWFLPFAAWYVLWLALIANSAWELADGDAAFGLPSLGAIFLLLGWTLWRNRLWGRSAEAAARTAVEQALKERGASGKGPHAWLDQDRHIRLAAMRRGRLFWAFWYLGRADEDQFDEIVVQGRAPVTVETYVLPRIFPRVPRFVEGAMMTAGGDLDHVPGSDPGLLWLVRLTGLTGKGKDAHAFADTAELAELAEQLRTAEPVTGLGCTVCPPPRSTSPHSGTRQTCPVLACRSTAATTSARSCFATAHGGCAALGPGSATVTAGACSSAGAWPASHSAPGTSTTRSV